MNSWLSEVVVDGGLTATLAVALALQLRLVRFFDLGWAIWSMTAALVGVNVARLSSSFVIGVAAAGAVGGLMGMGEDYLLLTRRFASFVSSEIMEHVNFTASLAVYLVAISVTDVLGFRAYEMMPPTGRYLLGFSYEALISAACCWGALFVCAAVRFSGIGVVTRAFLDDRAAYSLFGFRGPIAAGFLGGFAGVLTGMASGCFGLLYFAHQTTGFSLMLLAVIPCILVGSHSSARIIGVALAVAIARAGVRTYFGEIAAEFLVYATIIVLLFLRPEGLGAKGLRSV